MGDRSSLQSLAAKRNGQIWGARSNRSMNPVLADGFFQEAEAEAGEQFHGSSAS